MSVRRLKKTRALAPPERVRQNTSMPFFSCGPRRKCVNNSAGLKMLQWSRRRAGGRYLHDASPLDAQRVLVDGDGHLVLQDGAGLCADGAKVVGHVEWSGHDGPQRHLGARLLGAEAKVTDNQLQPASVKEEEREKSLFIALRRSHSRRSHQRQ